MLSLLAVVSVVCLTLAFSSCSKKDADNDLVNVDVVWSVDIDGDEENTPEEVKKQCAEIGEKIEARAMQIYGGNPFKLPADKNLRPSLETSHNARARFSDDSQIRSLAQQLSDINTKYDRIYVYSVRITLFCDQGDLGSDTIRL